MLYMCTHVHVTRILHVCYTHMYMYMVDQINIYVFQHAVANSRHTMVYVGDIHDYFY